MFERLRRYRMAARRGAPESPAADCAGCRHFCNESRTLERELPGLAVLSSGDAAVRDQDGLCALHGRLTGPRNSCPGYEGRDN